MNKKLGKAIIAILLIGVVASVIIGCKKKETQPAEQEDMSRQTAYIQKDLKNITTVANISIREGSSMYPVVKFVDADAVCYVYVSYAISCVARTTEELPLK